jgi:hypothetical protein
VDCGAGARVRFTAELWPTKTATRDGGATWMTTDMLACGVCDMVLSLEFVLVGRNTTRGAVEAFRCVIRRGGSRNFRESSRYES